MKSYLLSTTCLLVLFVNCNAPQKQEATFSGSEWQFIYKNDKNGQHAYGDKAKLIHAVRKGYSIRIGWSSRRKSDSTKSVEHMVDATFLTIANQQEVFAQITPFWAQRPDLTSDTLSMTALPSQSSWLFGTNGTISSVGVDFVKDSTASYPPSQFRHALSWYAEVPNNRWADTPVGVPLWDD
ncbi:MAG: hypothetical protein AAGB24_10350 [Bacteroidota bacterium]